MMLGSTTGTIFSAAGSDALLCDQDARLEIVRVDVLGEVAHLFDADGGVSAELDPDGADGRERVWGGGRGERGVFLQHGRGGFERGRHLLAIGGAKRVSETGAKLVEGDGSFFLC